MSLFDVCNNLKKSVTLKKNKLFFLLYNRRPRRRRNRGIFIWRCEKTAAVTEPTISYKHATHSVSNIT